MEDMETRIERIPVPVPPRLVITTKDGTREVPLGGGQLILGRGEDNDVVVAADAVSRRHASLELRDEGVLIKDLGSTNGIAVDGQVMPEILLLPDMRVTIGTSVALAYLPPEAAPTALEILEALAAAAAAGSSQDRAADEEVTATAPGPDVHTEEPAPQADILAEEPVIEATAEADALAEEPVIEAIVIEDEPAAEVVVVEEEPAAEVVVEEEPAVQVDVLAEEPAAEVVVVEEEPAPEADILAEEPAAEVVVVEEEPAAEVVVVEDEPAPEADTLAEEPAADVVVLAEEPAADVVVVAEEQAAAADEAPADSWYVARGEGEPAWQGGPYTWAELAALAQDGSLTGGEFVWYESRQEWVVVSQVPELLPQPAAAAAAAPDVTVVLPVQGEPSEAFAVDAAATEPPAEPGGEELESAPAVGDDSQGWYLSHSGAGGPDGPYAWSELPALGRDGAIRAGDLVWHASYADWVPVEQVPELAQYLPTQAAPAAAVVAEGVLAAAPAVATLQPAEEAREEPAAVTPASIPAAPASVPDLAVTASVTLAVEPGPSPAAVDMAAGWYMSRGAGESAWQGGPYSWEELVGYARDGRLIDGDLVWHAAYGAWMPPAQVPGLRP